MSARDVWRKRAREEEENGRALNVVTKGRGERGGIERGKMRWRDECTAERSSGLVEVCKAARRGIVCGSKERGGGSAGGETTSRFMLPAAWTRGSCMAGSSPIDSLSDMSGATTVMW